MTDYLNMIDSLSSNAKVNQVTSKFINDSISGSESNENDVFKFQSVIVPRGPKRIK